MRPAHQRGGAAIRSRPAALGSVAGRLPARRQPPAGPGPERDEAVTRAGGRRPRTRPRHRQRILRDHPEPPDRHQLRREPSLMCSPRRRPANLRSSPSGTNTRAPHRQPAHRQAARQQPAEHPGHGAARARPARAHHQHLPLRRRRRTPAAARRQPQQGREPAHAAPRPVLRPSGPPAPRPPATRPARRSASHWSPTARCGRPPTPAMRSTSRCDRRATAAADERGYRPDPPRNCSASTAPGCPVGSRTRPPVLTWASMRLARTR